MTLAKDLKMWDEILTFHNARLKRCRITTVPTTEGDRTSFKIAPKSNRNKADVVPVTYTATAEVHVFGQDELTQAESGFQVAMNAVLITLQTNRKATAITELLKLMRPRYGEFARSVIVRACKQLVEDGLLEFSARKRNGRAIHFYRAIAEQEEGAA
ncbi:MAG: hypothetical protein AAF215_05465 [Cyanobacteria bacterium P01_A01_bin.123]